MKRLIVLLTLITLIFAINAYAECTETDDGKEITVKGTTTYSKNDNIISENIDFCKDEGTLLEYWCDEGGKSTSEYFHCDCVEGACVDVVEETPEEEEDIIEEEPKEEEPIVIPPQETPPEEPEVTPAKADNTWIWVAILVIVIVAVIMFLKLKKKKGKKEEGKETEKKK